MEFIELADYPLPGGHVIEWLPTATTQWTDWPRDQRAASHNHEQHLRDALARSADPRQCWLGHAFRVDGTLDVTAWRVALDRWIDRHEGLRTHVAIENGRPARYTAPPGTIGVHPVAAGSPASTVATHHLVQRLVDEATSPLRWPAYVCVTIGTDAGFTVLLAADHSIMDGYSTIATGGELRAIYDEVRAGIPSAPDDPGSYLDFCDRERAVAAVVTTADPAVAIWDAFLTGATPAPGSPREDSRRDNWPWDAPSWDAPACTHAPTLHHVTATPVVSGYRTEAPRPSAQRALAIEVLGSAGADAAAAHAGRQRQGLFAVLLAAFAATAAENGAGQDFRTVVPLHTRSEPRWANTLGWFVGLAPFALNCTAAQRISDLIGPAGTEIRRVRVAATVPFARVCELLEIRPRISFMVSYMDCRFAPASGTWLDTDTRWLRGRAASDDEYYFWFLRTPAGVSLNIRYPGNERATHDVHTHVLRLRELLTEFAAYGDATIRPARGAPLTWK